MDHKKQPIKLSDLITEISMDTSMFPCFEDILIYTNEKYKMFEDRFDFSQFKFITKEIWIRFLDNIEWAYWHAGIKRTRTIYLAAWIPNFTHMSNLI